MGGAVTGAIAAITHVGILWTRLPKEAERWGKGGDDDGCSGRGGEGGGGVESVGGGAKEPGDFGEEQHLRGR